MTLTIKNVMFTVWESLCIKLLWGNFLFL